MNLSEVSAYCQPNDYCWKGFALGVNRWLHRNPLTGRKPLEHKHKDSRKSLRFHDKLFIPSSSFSSTNWQFWDESWPNETYSHVSDVLQSSSVFEFVWTIFLSVSCHAQIVLSLTIEPQIMVMIVFHTITWFNFRQTTTLIIFSLQRPHGANIEEFKRVGKKVRKDWFSGGKPGNCTWRNEKSMFSTKPQFPPVRCWLRSLVR